MTRHRTLALCLLAATAAVAGCDERGIQDIVADAPAARVKFFNFGVSAPGVNFFANDQKLTAVSSTACTPLPAPPADSTCLTRGAESTTGTGSGGAAVGGFYVGLPPGQYSFSARIAAATDNGLSIATIPGMLETGKLYSLYLSGFYDAATKRTDGFVVEDVLPATVAPDSVYIRFVHASANAPAVRLAFRNSAGSVNPITAAPVAYRTASPFVAFSGSGVVDVQVVNPATNAVVFTRTAVSFEAGRVYTVALRGDWTVSPTGTSATRPQLDNTANR